jgi:hypothetical protein
VEHASQTGLDFDARYKVHGYGGVAFYLLGYVTTRDEDYEWTGLEDVDASQVRAVMVGDDYVHIVDVDDLTVIAEDDYCAECGQIGCTADGRERG